MPPDPVPVALLGLSEPERRALHAYFCLDDPARPWSYAQMLSVDDAAFVVADADQPGTLELLQALGRVADTVFVGSQAPLGGAAWMMRPLAPQAVLRELDRLQAARARPETPPLRLTLPRELDSDFAPFDALAAGGSPAPARRRDDRADDSLPRRSGLGAVLPADARPVVRRPGERVLRPLVPARTLVVDDSAIALHFLKRLLQPYRLTIDTASTTEEALEMLATEVYGLVFLDVDLGEAGRHAGLQLCHRVRHQFHHPGGRPPMVVMVSAFHDPVDRVRGTLAGAEAFLGKPLDTAALDQLLRRLGFAAVGEPLATPEPPDPRSAPHRGWR